MSYKTKLDPSASKTIQVGGKGADGTRNPTEIEGYYLGAKETDGQYGPGKLHIFQTSEGNVGVWGKSNSNRLLTGDLVGQMVKLTFTGMSKPAKGKRPAYLYQVQHDPENTIDASGIDLNASEDSDNLPDYGGEEDSDVFGDESNDYEEPIIQRAVAPKVAAKAPSAAQQAKVQALLNRK